MTKGALLVRVGATVGACRHVGPEDLHGVHVLTFEGGPATLLKSKADSPGDVSMESVTLDAILLCEACWQEERRHSEVYQAGESQIGCEHDFRLEHDLVETEC